MNLWEEIFEKKGKVTDNPYDRFYGFYLGQSNEASLAFLKSLTGILRKHFQMIEMCSDAEKEDCLSDIFCYSPKRSSRF